MSALFIDHLGPGHRPHRDRIFSGFYMVPLYTLRHSNAEKSKGELVATSNFINVTGAIAASILFKLLVLLSASSG